MRRRHFIQGAATTAALAMPALARAQAAWKPAHAVTIVVPWAAGGSTDQCVRVIANELQSALGQSFVVVNQPGASGSIGTRNVLTGPHDGYTWASGAASDLGCYKVLGLLDTKLDDWGLYLAIANVSVICANPSAPYKDFGQLLTALTGPGGANVSVATAGISSGRAAGNGNDPLGHQGELPARAVRRRQSRRHRRRRGRDAAVACLLVEAGDMIKAKRLVPLAALADKPVPLDGFGDVPPVTNWIPGMSAPLNYFGIWLPKDAPAEVHAAMQQVWADKISKNTQLQDYARRPGGAVHAALGRTSVYRGDEARAPGRVATIRRRPREISPDTIGISRG